MLKKISDLPRYLNLAAPKKKLVVACAQDETVLTAALKAASLNYVEVILTGDSNIISEQAEKLGLSLENVLVIPENDPAKATAIAVKMIYDDQADLLLKGQVPIAALLKFVYHKEFGIKKSEIMSHIALFEIHSYNKLIALTDAVINIAPDLKTKQRILENSIAFLRKTGLEIPRIAALAAVEMINPAMSATIDAGLLARMSQIGQIANCIIEGPLTFDRAINQVSVSDNSQVSGQADLLLAPDIESASMLYRSFLHFGKAKSASVLLGAKVPIIISTMADTEETITNSILLSSLIQI
jgi:phosphate butyryltransferase